MEPVVVKIGGALLNDEPHMKDIWMGIRALQTSAPVVLVHGGGPQATEMARRLGHEPLFVHGRRVTTDLDLQILQWIVCGTLNKSLVAQAWKYGVCAAGLSAADGGLVQVDKRPVQYYDGNAVDFGHVGDVRAVDPTLLLSLLEKRITPIVAPLGLGAEGRLFNVNADTIALNIAHAINAKKFLLITESGGVWQDIQAETKPLEYVCPNLFEQGKQEGWIYGGMQVKLQVALEATERGVPEVFILGPKHVNEPGKGTRVFAQSPGEA